MVLNHSGLFFGVGRFGRLGVLRGSAGLVVGGGLLCELRCDVQVMARPVLLSLFVG